MGWIILSLIAIFIVLLIIHIKNDDSPLLLLTILIVYLLSGLVYSYFDDDSPKAIDVYRNKTTLKISYIDSVAVDSVVVFK